MADCFEHEGSDCPLVSDCALSRALREKLDAFFAVLARHTIASLVEERPTMRMLLGLEIAAVPPPALPN